MEIKGYRYYSANGAGYSLYKINSEIFDEVIIITPPHWELIKNKDGLDMFINSRTGDKALNIVGKDGIPYLSETQSGKIYKCRLKKTWGGPRSGAGAKRTLPEGARTRSVKMTDSEFEKVKEYLLELRNENRG